MAKKTSKSVKSKSPKFFSKRYWLSKNPASGYFCAYTIDEFSASLTINEYMNTVTFNVFIDQDSNTPSKTSVEVLYKLQEVVTEFLDNLNKRLNDVKLEIE